MDCSIEYNKVARDSVVSIEAGTYNDGSKCLTIYEGSRGIFPYTSYLEKIGKDGSIRIKRINVDAQTHILEMMSTNIFRNNIYLKEVSPKDILVANKVYTIHKIHINRLEEYHTKQKDYCSRYDITDAIQKGEITDCWGWFKLIKDSYDRYRFNGWCGLNDIIVLELREVYDIAGIDTVKVEFRDFPTLYKIHRIIRDDKYHFHQPTLKCF